MDETLPDPTVRARRARSAPWIRAGVDLGAGRRRLVGAIVVPVALSALLGACDELLLDVPPEAPPKPLASRHSILAETIGELAYVSGGDGLRVRGFGVVIGLEDRGSTDCPTALREYLVEFLGKEYLSDGPRPRTAFSIERMIDSPDTAVVEVSGRIPNGAIKGTVFDVQVQAVPGTSTTSLEGGVLIVTELRLFDPDASGRGMLAGRALARARGPVFTNPFVESDGSGGPESLRRGFVLGGAVALEPRPFRLLLTEPSYPAARRIESRINEYFGQRPRTAEALSRGIVQVSTPARLAASPDRFIRLATHLYVRNEPAYVEEKLRALAERLDGSSDDLEHLALLWEGIGRSALPHIQPLYGHEHPSVRYYAARAGLRLKDASATPVVLQAAFEAGGAHRLQAVREIAQCAFPDATTRLVALLDRDDVEQRVAAYEALRAARHPAIRSRSFAHDLDPLEPNFTLDVVSCGGPPMIYVRRTAEPRIALFGGSLAVQPPVFYHRADDRATIAFDDGDEALRIGYRPRLSQRTFGPILAQPNAADLVAALAQPPARREGEGVAGAGLTYSQVVQALAELARAGSIRARLELERTSLLDLLGPEPTPTRPETDAARPDAGRAAAEVRP